ncbi:hypothetical protein VUN82_04180 [Micrococcaceae bacterium Sec5.1]|uniref:hypothetical protein n=1 Tax=Paenarthrobacter sp. RAF54_2 TaxID=3233061 RepID=UPI003368826A
MSDISDWDDDHKHSHTSSCDHQRARSLDVGPARETPEQYAERVDTITNDPHRIEKRKHIAAALTVPRRR